MKRAKLFQIYAEPSWWLRWLRPTWKVSYRLLLPDGTNVQISRSDAIAFVMAQSQDAGTAPDSSHADWCTYKAALDRIRAACQDNGCHCRK